MGFCELINLIMKFIKMVFNEYLFDEIIVFWNYIKVEVRILVISEFIVIFVY